MTSSADLLAYIPSPPQGVWYLGPVALRAYALFIVVGIVVAIVWGDRRWVARGGDKGTVLDVAIWAVPFGLIGGRLYHVMTDWPTYFGDGGRPLDALKVWQGGLGIWGAVALGGVGAWIACRRRGIPLPAFGDAVAPGILLAQAIGRIGNYFNQELYGRETTVPWGLEIFERRNDAGTLSPSLIDGVSTGQVVAVVHPTFLYEALWNVLVVVALVLIDRRFRIGHGRLFALYVAGYCLGRFWIEMMRTDHASLIAGIRVNSFTSAIVFVAAVAYVVLATKGREDPEELKTRRPGAPAPAVPVAAAASESAPSGSDDSSAAVSAQEVPAQETPAQPDDPTATHLDDTESGGGTSGASAEAPTEKTKDGDS